MDERLLSDLKLRGEKDLVSREEGGGHGGAGPGPSCFEGGID